MKQIIVLIGAPGSGKGTQTKMLSEYLNLQHITMGDVIRNEVKNKSEIGKKVHKILENGDLLPDEITNQLFMNAISNTLLNRGFISDGFPRTIAQAVTLNSLSEKENLILRPIFLEVDYQTIYQRLLIRKRSDDTQEVIKNRYSIFINEISAILKFYKNKLITVNANQDKENVFDYIIEKIKS